jgi:hypothetical protein
MMGGSVAEFVDEHCSDGAGLIRCAGLPRAAGCYEVSGFDLRLDHHGPRVRLVAACLNRMIVADVGRLRPLV